ncbi:MAG: M23 family metallopeptidase [Alphaproteobacteria bacterium]|nr:M23 family metallopeptidase [Alphaproteobacteria bacterium]
MKGRLPTLAAVLALLAASPACATSDAGEGLAEAVLGAPADQQLFLLRGELVQGGLIRGAAPVGSKVRIDGYELPVTIDGHFVFGFDRDYQGTAHLEVTAADGKVETRELEVKPRAFAIQRIDGLPPEKVTPLAPEVLARIAHERAEKDAARPAASELSDFTEPFIWPLKGPITGVYGSQRVLNGEAKQPHYGVDVAAPVGTPVVAPAGGVVTLAEPDMYYEGGLLFIDHGHGLISAFMHLSSIEVKVGDRVKQGDVIAAVGATGRVTGAHLDWRMYWRAAHIDPALLVPAMEDTRAEAVGE